MKKNLVFLIIIFGFLNVFSQTNYYYFYKDKKIYLNLDKKHISINVSQSFDKNILNNYGFKDFFLFQDKNVVTNKQSFLEFSSSTTEIEYFQKFNSLKNISSINSAEPCFTTLEGKRIFLTSYFNVKLKSANDYSKLQEKANLKNVTIIKQNEYMPLWYLVKCNRNTIENSLEMANYFKSLGLFEYSEPDFVDVDMYDVNINYENNSNSNNSLPQNICVNDANFNQQWSLDNTGQWDSSLGQYSLAGTDIKTCAAWQITRGQGIKVAVFDGGIDATLNDLNSNLLPTNYDIFNNGPSTTNDHHGTRVAYIIAGLRNNNIFGSGVAPESKILDIKSVLYGGANQQGNTFFANGFNWGWQNGADVFNCSFSKNPSTIIEDAIINAMDNGRNGLGTLIVASSGNIDTNLINNQVGFPANIPRVISVGAINSIAVKSDYSKFEPDLDVVAPADNVPGLVKNSITGIYFFSSMGGTSTASPHVAGIAALILSINPCLTSDQVRNIIETTSQKTGNYNYNTSTIRPNGTWNNEMGYGLVNAEAAVLMAQQMLNSNTTVDLYIQDNINDDGIEPTSNSIAWNSPDIWVRNQDDTIEIHQSPLYNPTLPNYIYVKVRNKNCTPSSGNDQLKVYARLPNGQIVSTASSRIANSSIVGNNGFSLQLIATENIPIITAGQFSIIKIPWNVPNPVGLLNCTTNTFDTFIYAKIVSIDDPLNVLEVPNNFQNIINNNNIAGKNTIVLNSQNIINYNPTDVYESLVLIENPFDEARNFKIDLVKENLETGKMIYEEAEVSFKMDEILFNAWERGGKLIENISETLDEKIKIVSNNNVIINNINLLQNERGSLYIKFNFLINEYTNKNIYQYHLIVKEISTETVVGGMTFNINKNNREIFEANAGSDREIDKNETITITAQQLNEVATYNWYDIDGNLVNTGKDFNVSLEIARKFKLEVITADGFKDYDDVEIKFKPSTIISLVPNPAVNNIIVNYKVNTENNAYLLILGYFGTNLTSNNYVLDTNDVEKEINISQYPSGFYSVVLISNGQIIDSKTLIKE